MKNSILQVNSYKDKIHKIGIDFLKESIISSKLEENEEKIKHFEEVEKTLKNINYSLDNISTELSLATIDVKGFYGVFRLFDGEFISNKSEKLIEVSKKYLNGININTIEDLDDDKIIKEWENLKPKLEKIIGQLSRSVKVLTDENGIITKQMAALVETMKLFYGDKDEEIYKEIRDVLAHYNSGDYKNVDFKSDEYIFDYEKLEEQTQNKLSITDADRNKIISTINYMIVRLHIDLKPAFDIYRVKEWFVKRAINIYRKRLRDVIENKEELIKNIHNLTVRIDDDYPCIKLKPEEFIRRIEHILEAIPVARPTSVELNMREIDRLPEYVTPGYMLKNPLVGLINNLKDRKFAEELREQLQKYRDWNEFNVKFDFIEGLSLLIDNKKDSSQGFEAVNTVIYNSLAQLPAGYMNCTLIDTKYSGFNLTEFIHFSDINKNMFGDKIITNKNEIENKLDELIEQISNITQKKLSNKYKNIVEYNNDNRDNIEPIRLIAIEGFPYNFDGKMLEKLISIINNGVRCGVNVLIESSHIDIQGRNKVEESLINEIHNLMFVVKVKGDSILSFKTDKLIKLYSIREGDKDGQNLLHVIANSMNEN